MRSDLSVVRCLAAALALGLLPPQTADSAIETCTPELAPGTHCAFGPPDRFSDDGLDVDPPDSFGFAFADETILGSALTTALPLGNGSVEVYQENEFVVEGDFFGSVVPARFTGHVDVNGFLTVVGMGQVANAVFIELLDLGPQGADPAPDPKIVHSEEVSSSEMVSEIELGVGVGLDYDLGSATIIQPGGGIGISTNIPLGMEIVRDSTDFAFDAPVQRGHDYRLRVRSEGNIQLGPAGAFAQVSYLNTLLHGSGAMPNLLDPDNWIDILGDDINTFPPELSTSEVSSALGIPDRLFTLPSVNLGSFSVDPPGDTFDYNFTLSWSSRSIANPLVLDITTHEMIDAINDAIAPGSDPVFPKTVREMLDLVIPYASELDDELEILDPGVRVSNLQVRIAQDAQEVTLLANIERNLSRRRGPVATFQLPEQFGGQLEYARAIVADVIARMAASGRNVRGAQKQLGFGDEDYDAGRWKTAYTRYRKAYRKSVR